MRPSVAASLIEHSVLPFVQVVSLTGKDVLAALVSGEGRGVRGGAVYDLLHLVAARKSGVDRLMTLDPRNFQALARPGDPSIESP